MKKITKALLDCFAVGVLAALLAGALAFVGYLIALVIGGNAATQLCAFIYKSYFPWVIRVCSVAVGLGLIGMYTGKMQALSMEKKNKEK